MRKPRLPEPVGHWNTKKRKEKKPRDGTGTGVGVPNPLGPFCLVVFPLCPEGGSMVRIEKWT
jgi:hypothetical protein